MIILIVCLDMVLAMTNVAFMKRVLNYKPTDISLVGWRVKK
jgi:hypothetical protein